MRTTTYRLLPVIAALIFGMVEAAPSSATAQSMSVSPTKLVVVAPGSQAILIVKAAGAQISIVQARVMAWNEMVDPAIVTPTRNVVISPPAAELKPGQELSFRIVRVSKTPVRTKECYRVLIDRLPGTEGKSQGIKLQIRHSIPLCFTP